MRRRRPSWVTLCHAAGFLMGGGLLISWPLTGQHPDSGAMTFATALVLLPHAAHAQERRNDRRRRK